MPKTALFLTLRRFFNMNQGRASYRTIRKRIEEDAEINGLHLITLILAMLIASIGLNVDSTEAVIGAMLICPLMGSVLAIAFGVAAFDRDLLKSAITGLAVQMVICLITSTLYFSISPLTNLTDELLSNSTGTIWDVLIAFAGGFAGALGTSRRQEPGTLIAGVAVATALMPPLCSVGFGIATRDLGVAFSALYEFLINVVFIAFGAEIVLVALRVPINQDLDGDGIVTPEESEEAQRSSRSMRHKLVVGSLLFAVPCLLFSATVVRKTLVENGGELLVIHDLYDTEITTRELSVMCPYFVSYRVGSEDSFSIVEDKLEQKVVATVETRQELTDEQKEQITSLVRLHYEDMDEVEFAVSGSDVVNSSKGR